MFLASFSLNNLIDSLIGAIQGLAIVLILIGMASAFLYKVAFYVQLIIGLVETIIVTYIAYSISQFLNLGFWPTVLIFFVGLGYSLYQAAKAALMAILNGFLLCAVGALVLLSSGSGSGIFANFAINIVLSIIISVFLVGIAAYAGGHMSSLIKVPKFKRPTQRKLYENSNEPTNTNKSVSGFNSSEYESRPYRPRAEQFEGYSKQPFENQTTQVKVSQNKSFQNSSFDTFQTRIMPVNDPSKNVCCICKDEWSLDSEIYRCENCSSNFHKDCISQYVNSKHQCPQCHAETKVY
jgi:hypothetical protein